MAMTGLNSVESSYSQCRPSRSLFPSEGASAAQRPFRTATWSTGMCLGHDSRKSVTEYNLIKKEKKEKPGELISTSVGG